MGKIGLYFGSFNPVHIGHIVIAGYMTEFTDMDEIWFVVTPQNPLKNKNSLLDDYQRLHMVNLGIGKNEKMRASDIEFRLPVPSYTINTLAYLNEKYPRHNFCLVMGEDNLYTLHKWKNATELVKKYELYVYPRPGTKRPASPLLDSILSKAVVHRVKAPLMDISGTFIRNGVKKRKDMSYYLPAPVWKYIQEMHYYEK
ncbi:MAG TPA: nicotinic acid mononucleotide adenylyltransferase [Bacteroidales bacterium]|nr:nicotinic acid mononucleotide adenylyltransferase [Bacteroidales bacterium]